MAYGAFTGMAVMVLLAPPALASAPAPPGLTEAPAAVVTAAAFPDSSSGWALGTEAGTTGIWHTTTSGATWRVQWQGSGTPLALTATDPSRAWALVACRPRASCGRELLGTSDGGARWRVLTAFPAAVNEVSFTTADLGVAVSDACLANLAQSKCPGQLLVSRDGGQRWTTVLRASGPVFGTIGSSGQLWAAETTSSAVRFLASTTGGTWSLLGQENTLGPLSPQVRVTLAAAGGTLARASVFDRMSCAMHGCGVASLLSTGDGGRSWSVVSLPDAQPDECGIDGITFSAAPDGAVWAAAGRNGGACSPPLGLVYRNGPDRSGWRELAPWQLAGITSIDAVSSGVAYAISDLGVLSRTGDGGQHWTQLLPGPSPTGQLAPVNATTALAAQDANDAGAVLRSADGGRHWRQVADLPGVVIQLDALGPSRVVAATYSASASGRWSLWLSTDGGYRWTRAGNLPATKGFIDGPWMSADGHGLLLTVASGEPWAPDEGGTGPIQEWTTSDWGSAWTRGATLPLGRDTFLGPASFAYAGAWSGWLSIATASFQQELVTAGKSLTVLSGPPPLNGIQLLSPGTGFAWGIQGSATLLIYRTTDGARTWQHFQAKLPAGPSAGPLLAFSSSQAGWLTLGGTTWHTADGGRTWSRA